jgi:hypothetical protein
MNNWMHYVKKKSKKHINNAGNSVHGKKTGHQKLHYWESESYSGSSYLDENGVVHESTGREHLEELCKKANEEKLQQTTDTPLMTGDLQEDVEWLGIGPAVCMMLDGTYNPPPRRWMSTLKS